MKENKQWARKKKEMYSFVEHRIQELVMCLISQDFLKEFYLMDLEAPNRLPFGYGLIITLPMTIARGEACKVIMREGLR